MISRGIVAKTVWERRRSFVGWSAGLLFVVVISVAPYASFKGDPALRALTERLPDFVRALTGGETDFLSPEGWLNGRLFALMLPLLFAVFAIGRGAEAVAGEEGRGTLELVLATPVSRTHFFLAKLGALALSLALVAAVTLLGLVVTASLAGMHVAPNRLAAAMVASYLLALFHGALALGVGGATGNRGAATAAAAVVAVAGYLVNSLAELWDFADRIRFLSPFVYAEAIDPLRGDLSPADLAVLAALTVAATCGGLWFLMRRDLGV